MSTFVGVQIGAISFVDEGVGDVLDVLRDKAGANAVVVASQSFDRGVQGRQIGYRPWPGHGPRELDDEHFGGSYVRQHPEYYGDTVLGPYRAPDPVTAGFDALGDVIPAAHERDMRVYAFILENTHSGLTKHVPNWPKVLQQDAWGRADMYACLRNPDYQNWWLSIVEDHVKSYPLDGVMWGSERNGPLDNLLSDGGFARNGNPYCFCAHCEAAAERAGIDARRAREGYLELYRLVTGAADAGATDTRFVRFLRLLMRYPEIVAWDQLWHEGYEAFQARLYGAVKFLAPDVQVGWHVWHHNSFSPVYRSQVDFGRMATYSDFVKPVLYNNCAGYRLHHYVSTVTARLFEGVSEQTVYDLVRGVLGYDEAMPFEELPARGLSPDYVARETRRTVAAVGDQAVVYPGLDVNVPTPEHVKQTTPDEIRRSLGAALDGGAQGVILSRKYSEMTHENLAAVGAELTARGLR
ncbi:hypothetical protein [Jiangella mangrovi]|uniref:Uncharacterized protein n=1 Tax=Jiangella mangrovi TaxID=1524084 RepID=A0A7W9GU64_9ACTN|nr:hypothetical protein [Jiangella mangrovi]MBB5790100.1 hypothetical protein [Jiangella mangrovi]